MKDGPKNRLRAQDIHKIVDVFNRRLEVDKYSRMVPVEEIERNEFNLNLPRYIDSQEPENLQDIEGHLRGGIPAADIDALQRFWMSARSSGHTLFRETAPATSISRGEDGHQAAIYEHPEFAAFIAGMNDHFAAWRARSARRSKRCKLVAIPSRNRGAGREPARSLRRQAADRRLRHLPAPDGLLGRDDADDCYLIAADGWKAEASRIIEKDKKGKEKDKGWTCDLVPKALIVARYFAEEQAAIDKLTGKLESVDARLAELEEEQSGEDGAFADFEKVAKAGVAARLKEIKGDADARDEPPR